MRICLSAVALLGLCSVSAVAHADTISTFSLNNATFANGSTATGSVVIDVTSGLVTSGSFLYSANSISTIYNVFLGQGAGFDDGTQSFFNFADAAGDFIDFDTPVSSFIGYTGGRLCTNNNLCDGYTGHRDSGEMVSYATSGRLVQTSSVSTAVTPEPSSFVLLGTGALSLLGVARRKFRHA